MKDSVRQRVCQMLRDAVRAGDTPGISLLVKESGEETLFAAEGWADLESGIPLQRDSLFRLYSMTKPITAAAVMCLVQDGLLDLNTPVCEILPQYAAAGTKKQDAALPDRPMTVLHLFNMTSGLTYGDERTPEGRELLAYAGECIQRMHGPRAVTTVEFAEHLAQIPLAFVPDSSWCYGFSADVLGAVIEVVSGMRFGAYLQEKIFDPLHMNDTGFYVPAEKYSRLTKVYEPASNGKLKTYQEDYLIVSNAMTQPPPFESGGAGLVSTIDDYARFAAMLLSGGTLEGKTVLKPGAAAYLTSGSLTAPQQEAFRRFGGHEGYTYSHLMHRMEDPGQACFLTRPGEYGWAGWLGCYFANLPDCDTTILAMQQKRAAGTSPLIRRIRNVIFSDS